MTLAEALRRPLDEDLAGFLALLQQQGVPSRVSVEGDEQVLRVPAELVEPVQALFQRYPQGAGLPLPGGQGATATWPRRLLVGARAQPVTGLVLLVTLLVAGLTWLGDNLETVRWFAFVDFRVRGEYIYFASLSQMLEAGQWWRLFSPMLVHFGLLHLAMNSLWYWELGRRIEARQGHLMLLGLTLGYGLVSNLAQHVYGGPGIFGGLSGVLYGLLGHCWLFQRLAPTPAYRLPPGVLVLMLAWLVICLTGVIEVVSFGSVAIANAAHVSGLVAGMLTGALGGWLARRR